VTPGGSMPKQRGNNFEYRVLGTLEKLEYENCKRQPLSGASGYSEDKGDVIGSLNNFDFLFECKKTANKIAITFEFDWIMVTHDKALKMNRIPLVAFAGNRTDVFLMIEKPVFEKFHIKDIVLRLYKTRGTKMIGIRWAKVKPLLKGQAHEKDKLNGILFTTKLGNLYMFELKAFTDHLKKVSSKIQA